MWRECSLRLVFTFIDKGDTRDSQTIIIFDQVDSCSCLISLEREASAPPPVLCVHDKRHGVFSAVITRLTQGFLRDLCGYKAFLCVVCPLLGNFVMEWQEENLLGAQRVLPLTIAECLWPRGSGHYHYEVEQPPMKTVGGSTEPLTTLTPMRKRPRGGSNKY